MNQDVDLLRSLLLAVEELQRSPPEPVFLGLAELGRSLSHPPQDIADHLDLLVAEEFIEGPGSYDHDNWLFRKVTPRGQMLIDRIRDAGQWDEVKRAYGGR
jgi:hypothetical protein